MHVCSFCTFETPFGRSLSPPRRWSICPECAFVWEISEVVASVPIPDSPLYPAGSATCASTNILLLQTGTLNRFNLHSIASSHILIQNIIGWFFLFAVYSTYAMVAYTLQENNSKDRKMEHLICWIHRHS